MEDYLVSEGTVDPEVRAYVTSLVTALGGTGSYEDGRYVLGDDALACLKDIKRWLKLYDEKLNRLDVARVLAERNLVKGDLLEILSAWPEDATEDRIKSKVALACLELLVPLSWPIEKNELQITANHYRNTPYLQLAQIGYKREILEHHSQTILKQAVRVGIPSVALPMGERTQRDEGIIKLILYFFRNVVMISAPANLPVEWNENEVSRSATIEAFAQQDVFRLLLMMASNMGDDFNTQDTVILEVLFHLVKGLDVEKLFMDEEQSKTKNTNDLKNLMNKESAMLRSYNRNAPTRHNRFGTMIWVGRDDERKSAVSGQEVLGDGQRTLAKMDQSKKWNKPKQHRKDEPSSNHFDSQTSLTSKATRDLRTFVEDFLDAGFNPLMSHLRKSIEREAERVLLAHSNQYFYLISWFLEAERARRKSYRDAKLRRNTKDGVVPEPESFGLVASVLNQETFIALSRYMQKMLDEKQWHEVNSSMRAFTQILLTVQDMAESPLEDDQEIAENIQNRIFYEETTHDRILSMLRGYKDQGFSYLDACTELSHVFIRMLERYSKENIDMQIRSKRRARKKRKEDSQQSQNDEEADQDSEAEDVAEAQRVSKERKFDLNRFTARFVTQGCVDTFVAFTAYYKDLNKEQLKRAHRFFFRVAFKQEMSVILFRLDIIALFNRMIKGPEGLVKSESNFSEWEEFAKQLFRRMIKKMQSRPELAVELLFSKINSTTYYLEYGHEKQTMTSKPRAAAEIEVMGGLSLDEQIGVVVAAMHEESMGSINFVKKALDSALNERQSWEAEALARAAETTGPDEVPAESSKPPSIVLQPDNDVRRIQLFQNGKLRLLLALCGIERLGLDEFGASYIIPSSLSSAKLKETAAMIEKHRVDPKTNYGNDNDPCPAVEMLRRKFATPAARPARAEYDDDSDGLGEWPEEEFLFPAGGPTARKSTALDQLKKKRRKRKSFDDEEELGDGLDEEVLRARRKARLLADLEKRRKIKSEEFVHDSGDEDPEEDAEFFALESERAKKQAAKTIGALFGGEEAGFRSENKKRKNTEGGGRRKRVRSSDDHEVNGQVEREDSEDSEDSGGLRGWRDVEISMSPERAPDYISTDDDEEQDDDTPLSSQSEPLKNIAESAEAAEATQTSDGERRRVGGKNPAMALQMNDEDEEEEEDVLPTARRRARAAILDDSDED